ncbi:hypothetical protein PCURB6_04120 [Paenibacillus curdlanolyticus]|nr:hypothetical protein [Paenibacillus curdlanolyticus]GFN30152.1 hypothetical protein PCURB6_04120 [Paenibacillus curdlanolyticus]
MRASGKQAKAADARSNNGLRNVTLTLQSIDHPDIPPIDVPLTVLPAAESRTSLYDLRYEAEGSYLSLPGKWRLEVRVLDENLDEYVTAKTFYSNHAVVE